MALYIYCLPLLVKLVLAQNILSVLSTHDELSTLNFHLNASKNLSSLLSSANNFTFLAPSNAAFDAQFGQSTGNVSEEDIEAILAYHFLKGGFPTLSFSSQPNFAHTHLENGNLANVTGGQVVEMVTDSSGLPQFVSGNKTATTIAQADILCTGGIIHIVDEVLTIPPVVPVALTQAKLNFFISILQDGGFLSTSAESVANGVRLEQDVTFFAPNSEQALATFKAFGEKNPSEEQRANMFNYHVVQKFAGYSTTFKEGMQLQSIEGKNLTITKRGADTFVNGAKITSFDFLAANGVFHVIDNLLDPTNITSPPPITSPTSPEPEHKSTSKVAIGLGVSLPIVFCACLAYFLFWLLRRRKTVLVERKPSSRSYTRQIETSRKPNLVLGEDLELDVSPIDRRNDAAELFTEPKKYAVPVVHPVELDASSIRRY